nr:L,D-transpeptidase family protein [Bacillus marasmi]
MGNALRNTNDVTDGRQRGTSKRSTYWKILIAILILISALIAGLSYYQANHFNAKVSINGTNVGGLTVDEALKKLKNSKLLNQVFIGQQQVLDGKDTKFGFTDKDLSKIKKLQKKQWSFFPSSKKKNYSLMPSVQDEYRSVELKKELEQKLTTMNQDLQAPKDAQAVLEQGKIVITESVDGKQYDVVNLLKNYDSALDSSDIRLKPVYIEPIKEDSDVVKNEKKKLEELLQQSVDYKVQDQVYSLKANELIQNATVTKDLIIEIDPTNLNGKITEINNAQSTLGKSFNFKTHSGSVISVNGQTYGWALNVEKETSLVKAAFEKGETSVSASNIYGNGWDNQAFGYETTTNNGIGDTYAEVSISEQRMWIFKAGQLVFTTNVVTGKHSTGEDTSRGVWYILYKKTPYTLKGTAVGKGSYTADVSYWAPFTNSGQGFHDASWRKNWASNAYLTEGSAGCVNVPPNVMQTVYANLNTHDPVVIY